VLLRIFYITST